METLCMVTEKEKCKQALGYERRDNANGDIQSEIAFDRKNIFIERNRHLVHS